MGESTKAVLALLVCVGLIVSFFGWMSDQTDSTAWGLRIGGMVGALVAFLLLLMLHFRADLAPDYLRHLTGTYYNCDGFGFTFSACTIDGIAYITAHFINQRDLPCTGQIAMRPSRGFFLTRAKIETIYFVVGCAPGAFGFVRLAVPIPEKLQGKRQSFDVISSVKHNQGKGRRLRFHDGIFMRCNTGFRDTFKTAMMVAGMAAGTIIISKPASVTFQLPTGVASEIPEDLQPEIRTLWRLGDPPLETSSSDSLGSTGFAGHTGYSSPS